MHIFRKYQDFPGEDGNCEIHLPRNAFKVNTGGRPAEHKGLGNLWMVTVRHGADDSYDVMYPSKWKEGYMKKAELFQAELNNDYGLGLMDVERSPDDMPHLNHPAFKIGGKPFMVVKYKDPNHLAMALNRATVKYSSRAIHGVSIKMKTFQKDIIGMGFSFTMCAGVILFKLGCWNDGSYRIQEQGVTKLTGSCPNIQKKFSDQVPTFYKDFGTALPMPMGPITIQEFNSMQEGAAGLIMMMQGESKDKQSSGESKDKQSSGESKDKQSSGESKDKQSSTADEVVGSACKRARIGGDSSSM